MPLLLSLLLISFALPAWAAQLTAGPMLGHVTSRTATLWLQADGPAEVSIEYWPETQPQDRKATPPVRLDTGTDYTAHVTLTGLTAGTRYAYRVLLDGTPTHAGKAFGLLSHTPWAPRRPAADFTLYLGSCAFIHDPAVDRQAQLDDHRIFQSIARLAAANPRPKLMLWLGDNVYLREADYESPWGMNARYRQVRSLPALQPLLAALPHYAIWDDHDYGPNDANRSFVYKDESLRLFRRYWANPGYGLAELAGIFTAFSIQDVDLFLLDNRFHRAADKTAEPKEALDLMKELKDYAIGYNPVTRLLGKRLAGGTPAWLGENKVMFGAEQMDWLKQALLQSRATFKVIAAGSQMLNDANPFEGWQNFPAEREPFLAWLKEQNIPGVIFLSGDRHHTELIRREVKGLYPLYELTCSPLTALLWRPAGKEADHPQRVPGTLVSQRNFCSVEVTGAAHDRLLVLRSHDQDGQVLWERVLRAAELRRPETGAADN